MSDYTLPLSTQESPGQLPSRFLAELKVLGEFYSCPQTEQRGYDVGQQGSWELTLLRDAKAHTAQDAQRENLAVLSLLQF